MLSLGGNWAKGTWGPSVLCFTIAYKFTILSKERQRDKERKKKLFFKKKKRKT